MNSFVFPNGGAHRARRFFSPALLFLLLLVGASRLFAGGVTYIDGIFFPSEDGTEISANVFIPEEDDANAQFPAIIFVNSWALENHEYIVQAAKFAHDGYIVLSYSSRGWGFSGGQVNVAGPKDMEDLSAAVDWLEDHTPVDAANIGISGISYGGGISLLGLAQEPRLKTAVAMSSWADLRESLFANETPRLVWGGILVGSGYLTGNMDPIILEMYTNVLTNRNIPATLEWAAGRSPITYIDRINAKGAPVYISQNFGDELFQPNSLIDFYQRLETPKRLDLSPGIHATAELGGLIGISNFIWDNAHDWFDHWLKGEDNGVMDRPPVSMVVKNTDIREHYAAWPTGPAEEELFYMGPRGTFSNGSLRDNPNGTTRTNTIYSGILSGATTGLPVISPIFEAHLEIPILTWVPGINRFLATVYESGWLDEELAIRGIAELDIWIRPSKSQAQLVAHLYDMDWTGTGKLISHGPITLHDAVPGEDIRVTIPFVATAYDVPDGHKLVVAIDTYDPQYGPPTLSSFKVRFPHNASRQSVLSIPLVD
ncbi:Prolyl oligopeptidase family serine peptidase [Sulfidibacter corallicola]|uniref:Prolyl oligopeptidase family serine peptidase n=1 Tax=Sulfidibacter corallicola TaxID=2818388 RepID=A0A8A4TKI5_SULCO|nr:alpha/beta fold hydrolase [Sulfidibacter corallicola]QTD49987.1 prolyl oligopeptidase family serine peptidase [Sulfidibacter corallicola]